MAEADPAYASIASVSAAQKGAESNRTYLGVGLGLGLGPELRLGPGLGLGLGLA